MTACAAQCKCGVHGFAMNPCVSLRLATAPYYREARVTVARRQTACRMRHCCARRIDGCRGRRKLGCTSTRWAERQRISRSKPNRIAKSNAATPRTWQCNRQALQLFELLACNVKFSLGGFKGGVSLFEKRYPSLFYCRAVRGIFLHAKFCARAYDCATKRVRRGSGEKRKQNGGTRWRKRSWGARM